MKKKIFIPIIILSAIILLILTLAVIQKNIGLSFSRGLYLNTGSSHMLIKDNTPIVLGSNDNIEKLFNSFSNGDEIIILHDGIRESYPAQTKAYFCKKLSDGEEDDIPKNVLKALEDLNFTAADQNADTPVAVSYTLGDSRYGICPTDPRPEEKIKLIKSVNDMRDHWESVCGDDGTILLDPTLKYNEEFFGDNYLLLVYVFGQSGMTEYTVKELERSKDRLTVRLQSYTPELHTDDCYAAYIILEISRSNEIENEGFVYVEINGLRAFSYSDTVNYYISNNVPGLTLSGFKNTEHTPATDAETAKELAKKELNSSFTYKSIEIAFDNFENIWAVTFSQDQTVLGGCITVFLTTDGIAKATLSGE